MKVSELLRLYEEGHRDFKGANLSGADLSGADLSGANLFGASLFGANLFGVNLSRAMLSGANLTGANLSGAHLFDANLSGANLHCTVLTGAFLTGANLSDTNLSDITMNWSSHNLIGTRLQQVALSQEPCYRNTALASAIQINPQYCWNWWLANTPEPELSWALNVMRTWVKEGDKVPSILRS